jgi:hypothetical protein
MKSFRREDYLKRVDALSDQIDLFRRQCDCAKTDAIKRRRRRKVSALLRRSR